MLDSIKAKCMHYCKIVCQLCKGLAFVPSWAWPDRPLGREVVLQAYLGFVLLHYVTLLLFSSAYGRLWSS